MPRVSDYTKEEALSFIESLRLALGNRTGFRWLAEKLSVLSTYVEELADENDHLHAYLDQLGERDRYEETRGQDSDGGEE